MQCSGLLFACIVASRNNVRVWLSQPGRGYTVSVSKTKHINGTHPVYRVGRENTQELAGDPSAETKGPRRGVRSVEKRSSHFNRLIIVQLAQTPKELKKKKPSELPGILPSFMSQCFHFLSLLIPLPEIPHFSRPGFDQEMNRTAVPRVTTRTLLGGFRGNCSEVCQKCHAVNSSSSWFWSAAEGIHLKDLFEVRRRSRKTLISPESDMFHRTATLVLLRM